MIDQLAFDLHWPFFCWDSKADLGATIVIHHITKWAGAVILQSDIRQTSVDLNRYLKIITCVFALSSEWNVVLES